MSNKNEHWESADTRRQYDAYDAHRTSAEKRTEHPDKPYPQIAVSGQSGCGNSTVSRLVAEQLQLELINYTFRTMAEEEGISFDELRRRAELSDAYDIQLDRRQVELAEKKPCVLGSRLAVWMLKTADLKVYLRASIENRAERIWKREGGSLEERRRETEERDRNDTERYKRIYGIDNTDFSSADLVINTDRFDQYQTAEIIVSAVSALQKHQK